MDFSFSYYIGLAGIMVFTISGALSALEHKDHHHDLFSVFFTGFITAIGGGTLRDITLGNYPVSWVRDENILWAIFVGFLLVILLPRILTKLKNELFLFDTLGIGIYTVLGTRIALDHGVNFFASALLGMISAIFGGVIRDTLMNEVPFIFRKEIYATACLAGSVLYIFLNIWDVNSNWNLVISASLVVGIRVVAVRYNLGLPKIKLFE
ncbi:trimeric intracellular cation channel family protein [Leptospira bandrabouensis]|uniref:Trimeric intracellular cation channel family protein n=1 Tax=Leptospira bandrabouensis TaxID=2484903 RepID=A0A6H3NTT3_9LEPT|nr:trimeric intracellular cation channel family protein [Leptospira bandrabouensis]MCG6153527.1 trimeric intracellular cation channel family protein [Leptospira bandrabouensis]MCW7458399.1 trimeric intracellular cation channel family protein [Leptospira bandrabouensis]MCW7478854.1 trimeric intracellular cation channel family protein [Leptospira bandrabouensis]MCW7486482.1 trimeric intracellular cation channel family protein [Leptospira bandrabouensis]TGN05906.1 trimeric intracellular cation ch